MKNLSALSFSILTLVLYLAIAYFIPRENFYTLFGVVSFLFLFSYQLYQSPWGDKSKFWLGLGFRAIFLLAIPMLSDDYYRFLWDGEMVLMGINPFEYLPSEYINTISNQDNSHLQYLYENLNSPNYFSVYPPVSQLIYTIAALPHDTFGGIVIIKMIIILADIGVWWMIKKLLRHRGQQEKLVNLYWLNPFVIIELSGNLHFEGVMMFFFLWATFYFLKNKLLWSSVLLAIAVGVKLLPLMFLPLLFFRTDLKLAVKYVVLVGVFTIILFIPVINLSLLQKFSESVNLYFQSFEFNASIYYIFREIGFYLYGYNVIKTLGAALALVSAIWIIYLSWKHQKEDLFLIAMVISTSYLLFTTTVHPWYLVMPLIWSLFNKYRYMLVWTWLVFLSYHVYLTDEYVEMGWYVAIEYICIVGMIVYEVNQRKKAIS